MTTEPTVSAAPSTEKEATEAPTGPSDNEDKLEGPYLTRQLWEETHKPPTVTVEMNADVLTRFIEGYKSDVSLRSHYETEGTNSQSWNTAERYFKDERGLLFFRDADFHARLCVP